MCKGRWVGGGVCVWGEGVISDTRKVGYRRQHSNWFHCVGQFFSRYLQLGEKNTKNPLHAVFQDEGSSSCWQLALERAEVMLCKRVQLSSKRGWSETDRVLLCGGNTLTQFTSSGPVCKHMVFHSKGWHVSVWMRCILLWCIFRIAVQCLQNAETAEWKSCGAWPVSSATAPKHLFMLLIFWIDSSLLWR